MNGQRVTKEQAIRLKKAGYPTQHPFHVDINGNPFPEPGQIEITLSQCCNWLREVKGWHVATDVESGFWRNYGTRIEPNKGPNTFGTTYSYTTHDEAILNGIDIALSIIEKEVGNEK